MVVRLLLVEARCWKVLHREQLQCGDDDETALLKSRCEDLKIFLAGC
jgi:hypothetical protein